jgi:septum formation protein
MSVPVEHRLVLASASPRRRWVLEAAGVEFAVRPSDIPEALRPGEAAADFVRRLAAEKAAAVAQKIPAGDGHLVLGADTVVVVDDEILGKPDDADHALVLLRRVTGRSHRVFTGVALIARDAGTLRQIVVESTVEMRPVSEEELRAYVATGEPLDKAGAYAAQGEGRRFIERIRGSETNVIGLPMDETLALLAEAGLKATTG